MNLTWTAMLRLGPGLFSFKLRPGRHFAKRLEIGRARRNLFDIAFAMRRIRP
jgi:hypothetical protein